MGLREYTRKRHFERTPEPRAKRAAQRGGRSFVVQKHRARQLHYDFRLELEGTLKSWAVPKGPCLDPTVKRLAMHVEDHPVDYALFEGVIPEGEYGGGTVMLWDRGTWEPIGDPHEGYHGGRLKFILHGEKLRGRWMLVRTDRHTQYVEQRHWLLFKERDEEARPLAEGDILNELPLSVDTGRTMDEIAAARDRVWRSNRPTSNGKVNRRLARIKLPDARDRTQALLESLTRKKKAKLPRRVDLQLATLVKEPPPGDDWLHEMKFDGYRMACRIDNGQVRFLTRNHKDWTERLSSLANAARRLPVQQALLDGEVVAMRPDGTTDFQELQNAFRHSRADLLHYYVFDLLDLDGYDLKNVPLEERKRVLAGVVASPNVPASVHLSEHVRGKGAAFFAQACKLGLEGIVSKRIDGIHQPGRGYDWLKVKCVQKQEFVIGAYTEPAGSRVGLGALLVGYHDKAGDLIYAGKVGTGFDEPTLRSLLKRLTPLQQGKSSFKKFKGEPRTVHWVNPQLVAQIAFSQWTDDGRLRHPSFQGLREDKPPEEVTRDTAMPLPRAAGRELETKSRRRRRSGKQAKDPAPASPAGEYDSRSQRFAGVRLTSPEKVLYPELGVTKLELAQYYRTIAKWMLPHVANRPLVFVRCPEGQQEGCFYQKHPPPGTPETFRRIRVREKAKTEEYLVVDDVAGLLSIAQVSALEVHVWDSQADKLEHPDRLIFDLDPDPAVPWKRVVDSARQIREFLEGLGLRSFVKTTGGKGLHLAVPIEPRHDWNEVKEFCKEVADAVVRAEPRHYTSNMSKAARPGKIFVDYLRNARGATAIAPYSTRARPGASVSAPLSWKELSPRISSDHYTVRNMLKRVASLKQDPWEELASVRQDLAGPKRKLAALAR